MPSEVLAEKSVWVSREMPYGQSPLADTCHLQSAVLISALKTSQSVQLLQAVDTEHAGHAVCDAQATSRAWHAISGCSGCSRGPCFAPSSVCLSDFATPLLCRPISSAHTPLWQSVQDVAAAAGEAAEGAPDTWGRQEPQQKVGQDSLTQDNR
jgi:hypothetical protein